MNEAKVAAGPTPNLVRQPNHEYSNNYSEKVVEAFEMFADTCANTLGDPMLYPNPAIHVEPSPVYMRMGVLSFAAVWGRSTEMPLPKQHMIKSYFGSPVLGVKLKKKSRELTTLDAYGFMGAISLDTEAQAAKLSVAIGKKDSTELLIESYPLIDAATADYAMIIILADMIANRPLRFNQGVRWVPRNGYLGCIFSDADESRAQDKLLGHA